MDEEYVEEEETVKLEKIINMTFVENDVSPHQIF